VTSEVHVTVQRELPKTPLAKSLIAAAIEGRRLAGKRGSSKTWQQIESQCVRIAAECQQVQPGAKVARAIRADTWRRVCERLRGMLKGRTVMNYTRTMRLIMRGCGHDRTAADFTNESVSLRGLSRRGTKVPITDDHLKVVLERCKSRRDEHQRRALPVLIELMRLVGLRVQEVRMFHLSARPNLRKLETESAVFVRDGTKGGRYRDVVLSSEVVPRVRALLQQALRIADQYGALWPGENGRKAQQSLAEALRSVGLRGQFSPHSLRYRFAHDQIQQYKARDFDEGGAIRHVAMDLGHGGARRDLMLGTYYQKAHRRPDQETRERTSTPTPSKEAP